MTKDQQCKHTVSVFRVFWFYLLQSLVDFELPLKICWAFSAAGTLSGHL